METLLILAAALAQDVKVEITDQGFVPANVELKAGQKVIWMNATEAEHTATEGVPTSGAAQEGKKPLFDSGRIKPGGIFEFTFSEPGTYTYRCTLDPTMTGTVVVKPAD